MAFVNAGNGYYIGTSSDTKPSPPAGYRCYETDTGDEFIFDGTYWWLKGLPSPLSSRKVGYAGWATSVPTTAGGILTGWTAATSPGANNNVSTLTDTTNGRVWQLQTGATSGNKGGNRLNATAVSIRNFNPRLRIRFKMVDTTNMRMFFGFQTNIEPAGDDAYNAAHAMAFGISTSLSAPKNADWVIWHNDAAGATVVDDTGIAFDSTAVHTIAIVADAANNRFAWSLDGAAYVNVTTDIPGATSSISIGMQLETAEAVSKQVNIYTVHAETDK